MFITKKYLKDNPDHIFVFGDNKLRKGKKGAAVLRDMPNSYGFITKKYPSYNNDAYYKPSEYYKVFQKEIDKLILQIMNNPDKTYLISKLGFGLANRYGIWSKVIKDGLELIRDFKNVKFLF